MFKSVTSILQDELESMVIECSSLKDKMQYQRETAAASLNRIQKQNQEKCSELHSKIQDLSENVKEVRELCLFVCTVHHNYGTNRRFG